MHDTSSEIEKAVIVGVNLNNYNFLEELEELKLLAEACDIKVVHTVSQNLDKINSTTYIGKGKVEEIKEYINDKNIDLVIFDNELSPSQIKNLQDILKVTVLDRTSLILEIFSKRAQTKEAKIQVEMAKLEYMMPRLVGMNTFLGRQGGGSGLSNKGAGEKKLELDRRKIQARIVELNKELESIEKKRNIQRRKRENSTLPLVSLVGYTNAGKSTILNMLIDEFSKDDSKKVLQRDMLFATLDTSVRKITTKSNRNFLLSDTVGFVNKLPHSLVKAFRSTLEEVKRADLLIHVVDYSDENFYSKIEVTKNTLKEIGADNIPVIYVYNKADLRHIKIPRVEGDIIYMSALNKIGTNELVDLICDKVFESYINCNLFIPFDRGEILAKLNENVIIEEVKYLENGTLLKALLNQKHYNEYKQYTTSEI